MHFQSYKFKFEFGDTHIMPDEKLIKDGEIECPKTVTLTNSKDKKHYYTGSLLMVNIL